MRAAASSRVSTAGRSGSAAFGSDSSECVSIIDREYGRVLSGFKWNFRQIRFSYEKGVLISVLTSRTRERRRSYRLDEAVDDPEEAARERATTIPESNREVLGERTRLALRRVLLEHGITAGQLARAIQRSEHDRYYRSVRAYLSEHGPQRPRAATAWALGEALARLGARWSSGLWMLHVSGRLESVIGVVSAYLSDPNPVAAEDLRLLWRLLSCIQDLDGPGRPASPDYIRRSSASRELWLHFDRIRPRLQRAFWRWSDSKDAGRIREEDSLEAAYWVAASRSIPLMFRETAVHALLSITFAERLHHVSNVRGALTNDGELIGAPALDH